MRKIVFIFLSLISIFLISCSSNPVSKGSVTVCQYPDGKSDDAPSWICNNRLDGGPIFQSVGYAQLKGNQRLAERRATADARVKLAGRIQAEISSLLRDYTQQIATETGDTINTGATDEVTEEFIEQKITGTYLAKRIVSPNKGYYVLVAMDTAATKKIIQDTIDAIGGNDTALKEKFNLNEAMKRLKERSATQ